MTNHFGIKKIDAAKLTNLRKLFISDLTSDKINDRNILKFLFGIKA